jgi:septum formation topological specificity factor MinE
MSLLERLEEKERKLAVSAKGFELLIAKARSEGSSLAHLERLRDDTLILLAAATMATNDERDTLKAREHAASAALAAASPSAPPLSASKSQKTMTLDGFLGLTGPAFTEYTANGSVCPAPACSRDCKNPGGLSMHKRTCAIFLKYYDSKVLTSQVKAAKSSPKVLVADVGNGLSISALDGESLLPLFHQAATPPQVCVNACLCVCVCSF